MLLLHGVRNPIPPSPKLTTKKDEAKQSANLVLCQLSPTELTRAWVVGGLRWRAWCCWGTRDELRRSRVSGDQKHRCLWVV